MARSHFGRGLAAFGISLALWLIPATAGGSLGGARSPPRHIDHDLFEAAALGRGDRTVAVAVAGLDR